LYVANWPAKRSHAWKTLLQARAIENQCYVVAVNRTGTDGNGLHYSGDSCVINPMGEVLYSKANEEDTFTITLPYDEVAEVRSKFQFLKDGDDFVVL
jgi:predicted amidohydrolase